MNSDGEVLREFNPQPPTPGHDLELALDLDVQRIAEEELAGGSSARGPWDGARGAACPPTPAPWSSWTPRPGVIVAMAS